MFDRSFSTVLMFLYWQHWIAIFHFCIGNTIGILADNLLVAAYALSCLCIPVFKAVVEYVFSHDSLVFKMKKSCDFECVWDRYQCCVIFACFLSCVHGVFNSPVATLAYGLLVIRPSLRLRFVSENASLLAL